MSDTPTLLQCSRCLKDMPMGTFWGWIDRQPICKVCAEHIPSASPLPPWLERVRFDDGYYIVDDRDGTMRRE